MIRDRLDESFHHAVAFYESDDVLAEQIAAFLDVERAGTSVVVATPAHRKAIDKHLSRGVTDAHAEGLGCRYISLDADALLGEFLVRDFPDEDLFKVAMGRLFESARDGPVRVFGEMVALLWDRGHVAAALKLEKLWNALAGDHRFDLFCAYPTSLFEGTATIDAYHRMCSFHSHLMPFKG